ncbi:MAG: dNTP triphosphohydrolase [Planctomycetota bacterium]|nr:dNTP triphosphohydrolase [Planctomycetota bacterium]
MQSFAEREAALLAPYAVKSVDSQGRKFPEPCQEYRSPFQRDRDRILHSSAYRRLSGKMQVFTGEMGDYHRTRLTHTQEVSSIARTIARATRLNEDLVEALALCHDIGHPPYGHAGEDALSDCMADIGGFSHNQFGLTIVEEIEIRSPNYDGLNLSVEILDGQTTRIDKNSTGPRPPLEVQLVDAADSMTYDAHDTDDALKLGLVHLEDLHHIALVRESLEQVDQEFTNLESSMRRKALVHRLVNIQVVDLLKTLNESLARLEFKHVDEVVASEFLIDPSEELQHKKKELENFLYQSVYRHERLIAMRAKAQNRIQQLYEIYVTSPEKFPEKYQPRLKKIGTKRMAGEYIAGMTDRFFEQTYERISGERVQG